VVVSVDGFLDQRFHDFDSIDEDPLIKVFDNTTLARDISLSIDMRRNSDIVSSQELRVREKVCARRRERQVRVRSQANRDTVIITS
jgi:hypothetical protein